MKLLLDINKDYLKDKVVLHFDMEKTNPNISPPPPENVLLGHTPSDIILQLMWAMNLTEKQQRGF